MENLATNAQTMAEEKVPRMNPLTMVQSFREAGFDQKQADTLAYVTDRATAHLAAKIDGVQAELTAKIDGVQAELTAKIDGVQAELAQIRVGLADIRTEMVAMENRLLRWTTTLVTALFLASLCAMLGALYLTT